MGRTLLLVVIHGEIEKRKLIGGRHRYPAAACGRKAELGCNAHHDLRLPVCNGKVRRLDRSDSLSAISPSSRISGFAAGLPPKIHKLRNRWRERHDPGV